VITQVGPELGKPLHESVIKKGLVELNPGMHFDLGAATGQWHPYIERRQGVFFQGAHICSMDRGMIPEFKAWGVSQRVVPAQWAEADQPNVSIRWSIVPTSTPDYVDLCLLAQSGRSNEYKIRDDGSLMVLEPVKTIDGRGKVWRLGWRHTFAAILFRNIPGITHASLGAKFGIDALAFPKGAPEEVHAALFEE